MDAIRQSQLRELVTTSISSFGQRKGESIVICCPWHSEKNPSLHIHIGHKIIPGSFRCFGCNKSGNWNDIAEKLRLPKFEFRNNNDQIVDLNTLNIAIRDVVNSYHSSLKKLTPRTLNGTEELEDSFQWRGFSGKFYKRLGGKFYWDRATEREYLYFPLYMCDTYQGYTLCNIDGKDEKYKLYTEAYKVCFLYDLLISKEPVVIVEGHFDAIRLWAEGIPSVAIFGTQNWSDIKRSYIITKHPKKIILAFDGDHAGYEAAKKIWKDIKVKFSEVDIFYLPCLPNKLDPGNMPKEYVTQLRGMLYG